MNNKKALIIGINGMDGSYLAEFLLKKNYVVYGLNHKTTMITNSLFENVHFLNGNLRNKKSLIDCIQSTDPDEIYNFGANSFLDDSWNNPEKNADVVGLGVLRLLEVVKDFNKKIKIFQASSSEIFGRSNGKTVTEKSIFQPKTQYGCSKLYAYWLCKNYREYYNMYVCSGILFNHESERRSPRFVTRKITQGVAKIYLGMQDFIYLGNLESKKDWGYAPDYVEGMWKMLQQKTPDDYILCTSTHKTIKDFVEESFKCVGILDWEKHVKIDKTFNRPAEVDVLLGDNTKAKTILKWKPKTSFEKMISKMVKNDISLLKNN
jgi:GDPmannose 4,6-dehydratase